MFRTSLILSLTAMATANFTTTIDFRDWLIGSDGVGRSQEDVFGFRGSIINIAQNRTTAHVAFDQQDPYLATKYNPNNTNSFTFIFAPNYISAQITQPDSRADTMDLQCSKPVTFRDDLICTNTIWGVDFNERNCVDGAWGVVQTTTDQLCQNGTKSHTYTVDPSWMESQRKQVVLTDGLDKLEATATEATLRLTGTSACASATASGSRETSGMGEARVVDVALACLGAAVAVVMS
jgi:hypothetical protein